VPGGEVLGIEYEAIPILLFGLGGLLMVLVPFLDRKLTRTGRSPMFTAIGVVVLAVVVGLTAYGYKSLIPVTIVIGTAVLTAILAYVTRGGDRSGPPEGREGRGSR